jgi:hypothetical protein
MVIYINHVFYLYLLNVRLVYSLLAEKNLYVFLHFD